MTDKMTGWKGFDKDLKCRGMQFEVGKTATADGELRLCNNGLHFVENPIDAFSYYPPGQSRFAEVEASEVSDEKQNDSKRVARSLHIKAEVSIKAIVEASVKWVSSLVKAPEKTTATTGNAARSATTGERARSATTGNAAHSATTGYAAHSATTGDDAIAASLGINGASKAAKGSWIVCVEYDSNCHVVGVQAEKVDGKRIKADTFYQLKGGKFVEAA